jgi:hypothetical protein
MLEMYLKYGAIVAGVLLVLWNFVDSKYIISKLFKQKTTPTQSTKTGNKETDFLEIVSLWYQLKSKCDECKLSVASNKLDEVFPLLNGVLEDEN